MTLTKLWRVSASGCQFPARGPTNGGQRELRPSDRNPVFLRVRPRVDHGFTHAHLASRPTGLFRSLRDRASACIHLKISDLIDFRRISVNSHSLRQFDLLTQTKFCCTCCRISATLLPADLYKFREINVFTSSAFSEKLCFMLSFLIFEKEIFVISTAF
ncbi:hypothetical protein SprV_0301255500 [Sparganum proliferum]